jgi:hypothetical protein
VSDVKIISKVMIRPIFLVALCLLTFAAKSQNKVTLNGYVKDKNNGEELIGVTVYLPELKAGTTTNVYGFYSITVPPGSYDVIYSYVGYKTENIKLSLQEDLVNNLELDIESIQMKEIVIVDKPLDANVSNIQMSKNNVSIEQVRKLPALLGEVDIIKSIQMLPGVISAGEGTSSFFVRGGGADQNMILIDEAPIYDPSHLGGMVSVFNADVLKDSELYKGGIPARFGGRLSSILDVRTKDGNNKKFAVSGGLGSLASRLMVEGPLRKDKSSFILSARASNIGAYLKAANQDNGVLFYDINAKVNWRANNSNRFFVSAYTGRDKLTFDKGTAGFGWGNSTVTFRWNHLFNERLFSNTSVIASNFDYLLQIKDPIMGFKWTSNLQEVSLKNDLTYYLNTTNELTFGYHVTGRRFSPARIEPDGEGNSLFAKTVFDKMYGIDHGLYVSNEQRIGDDFTLTYGLRLSIFQNVGKSDVILYEDPKDNADINRVDTLHFGPWENIKTYINLEPRVGIMYRLSDLQSLKISYNRMVQNTHLITSGTVPLPFNTWNPSNYYLKPQLADQVAAGYFQNLNNNMFEGSVEVYYKKVKNVTDFADNAQIELNRDLSTEYRQGDSWSYGAEFMINKTQGRLTGMLSYTWSKTMREVEGVNGGKEFPASYDRRNVLNLNAAYDLNKRWTFGATFTYSTGRPTTIPSGKYEMGPYQVDVVTERNGYRLPNFHHFDLSATFNPKNNDKRKFKGQWVFSVYNVYSRQNAFSVYTRTAQDEDGNVIGDGTQKEARMIYLFPVLPFVTYNFKF